MVQWLEQPVDAGAGLQTTVDAANQVCIFAELEPVTGALELSTGVEHWSRVLEWTTGVASILFLYGINNKNMYV